MNEEFDEWFKTNEKSLPMYYSNPYDEDALKIAYLAGAAAGYTKGVTTMREKCAEVADNEANGFRNTRIAAAIRKLEVE